MAETNLEPERGTTSYKVSDKPKTKPAPIDVSAAQAMAGTYEKTDKMKVTTPRSKLGHRRVDEKGETTYKKTPSSALMSAIQLGIGFTVGRLSAKQERDVLMQDFAEIETVWFPSEGTKGTPSHKFSDFRFKSYAPVAFRFFRELFNMKADDFMMSLCNEPLLELSNPGASGSLFYVTCDNQFIIKTVDHKEADFLQKLLPGYYLNLNQNKKTLLPKFFGLFCYQCGGKNIRLVIMNNLLPTVYKFHWKYDLKGSTYKRRASKAERAKATPTLKDLDFVTDHPEGIFLETDTYNSLVKTIQRDCRVLESFKIMDYSLLVAIHNLDEAQREKHQDGTLTPSGQMNTTQDGQTTSLDADTSTSENKESDQSEQADNAILQRSKSLKGREGFSTAWEAITVKETGERPYGGIPARNAKGERLLLFIGVIDILQSYRLKKKLEHGWKSIVHDGDTVSVHRPSFYSKRFLEFMSTKVFKKLQGKEKTSPRKRSLAAGVARTRSMTETDRSRRERALTGEISTSLRSRSRSFNEHADRGTSDVASQKRKAATHASYRFRQYTAVLQSVRTKTSIDHSKGSTEDVGPSKENTEPQKGSPDSGIPPSPRNESVSNVPSENNTKELTNKTEDITHAQDRDTTDKLESSVHITSYQVANVDGENPTISEQSRTVSEETRKESDNTREDHNRAGDSRTVWERPWSEDETSKSSTVES